MNPEFPTFHELSQAFNSKMNGASFFFDKIKEIYSPGLNRKKLPNELFYYIDAVIFELHAASQMLLQLVNLKSGLKFKSNKVSWSESFKKLLEKENLAFFNLWEKFNSSPEFHQLDAIRQHLSHRGASVLTIDYNDKNEVNVIAFPIRYRYKKGKPFLNPTGKSIDIRDEILMFGKYLNQTYKKIKSM